MKTQKNDTVRTVISAAVFALVLSILFQSWEIAWVITISLAFHEAGHILMIHRLGIRWASGFNHLGAWTRTPMKARSAIGHYANSLIHLSGPLFSFLLSIGALAMVFVGLPPAWQSFWLRLANFSILLGLTNLLPIGSLTDGGKLLTRLSASIEHQFRTRFFLLMLLLFVILYEHLGDFNSARSISIVVLGLWFITGGFLGMRSGPVDESGKIEPMREKQARLLFALMIILILYSYLVILYTPFWLAERDVIHILASYEQGVTIFLQLPVWIRWTPPAGILAAGGILLLRNKRRPD